MKTRINYITFRMQRKICRGIGLHTFLFCLIVTFFGSTLSHAQSCSASQVHFFEPVIGQDKTYEIKYSPGKMISLEVFTPAGGTLGEQPGEATTNITYKSSDTSVAAVYEDINGKKWLSIMGLGPSTIAVHYNDDPVDCKTYFELIVNPAVPMPSEDNILYVNQSVDQNTAGYTGSGDSWANAIPELADALQWTREQEEAGNGWSNDDPLRIFVAKGIYLPKYKLAEEDIFDNPTSDQDKSFLMVKNVQLYGGFDPGNGIETLTDERIFPGSDAEGTILSGDFDGDDNFDDFDNHSENAYHVVVFAGDPYAALLEGFTITGGAALGSGIISVFAKNIPRDEGGGIYFNESWPQIRNTIIQNNVSFDNGGGVYHYNSYPIFMNSLIVNNEAQWGDGGGVYNFSSELQEHWSNSRPVFLNSVVAKNVAGGIVGGIFNQGASSFHFYNSILWDNKKTDGDLDNLYSPYHGEVFFQNSYLQGGPGDWEWNTQWTGIDEGENIISEESPFHSDTDFTLSDESGAMGAGDVILYVNNRGDIDFDVDLAGNPRIMGGLNDGTIDIGPFQSSLPPITPGDPANFITTWKTDNEGTSNDNQITIPTSGSGYNYDIYWEEVGNSGNYGSETGVTGDITLTFPSAGQYRVEINGDFPRIYFNNRWDKDKILTVEQWGSIRWESFEMAFHGCENLITVDEISPDLTQVTKMNSMFNNAISFNSDLSNWNVSNIENMASMFLGAGSFNGDIGDWDVSNVENMGSMFFNASAFNQDLSSWDVSSVIDMYSMFFGASSFNQDLSSWDVSSVTDMSFMFSYSALSVANYDATLIGWAAQSDTPQNLTLGANGLRYCQSQVARQSLIDNHGWTIEGDTEECAVITPGDPGNFITTWQTDNEGTSNDDQITIPTYSSSSSYSYNYNIYWEEVDNAGNSGTETGVTGSITLTFPSSGTYRIEINGDFPHIYFNNGGDKDKILTVDQWGNIQWKSMRNAFYGAKNMQLTTTVAPDLSQVSDMSSMFRDTETFNQDLSSWDVSKVRDMSSMFYRAKTFNSPLDDWNPGIDLADGCNLYAMFRDTEAFDQDLSSWDVSKVNDMGSMFYGAKAFNGSLEGWEPGSALSNGASLYDMFRDAEVFNQDLSSWDVTKVNDMGSMFYGAKAFNGPLVGWKPGIDLANGCSLYAMFRDTETFNQDLSSWDVSKVSSMSSMFYGAKAFNGPLVGWKPGIDLANGCSLYAMFRDTEAFDQDLSSWDVSEVNSMNSMFHGAKAFNGSLVGWKPGIDLANGCSLFSMFRDTEVFDQDLSSWDVSKVSGMSSMFREAKAFNGSLVGWKPGIDLADGCSLYAMFRDTETFDQDLNSWDVSSVTDMSSMFYRAKAFNGSLVGWKPGLDLADGCSLYAMFRDTETFNQDLSSWDISSVTNMSYMFDNSALSIANYDATLIGWAAQSVQSDVILGAHGLKYCQSQAARQSLIDDHGWTISGDTEECFTFTPSTDNILYVNQSVDQSATGYTGSGDSWANAIPELADALHWAREQHDADNEWLQNDSLRIYVAKGKYLPKYKLAEQDNDNIPTTDRDKSFLMVKNVQLYGGFPDSGNPDFADRDWESYETILSGDIGAPDNMSDNTYHVVVSVGEVGNALLNGFSIQDGNADANGKVRVYGKGIRRDAGGGLSNYYSNLVISNTSMKENNAGTGGGVYSMGDSLFLHLHNVIISNNVAWYGGGINIDGEPEVVVVGAVLKNVSIVSNQASMEGGGVRTYESTPILSNVTISGNTAGYGGGGMNNYYSSSPVLTNVTISGNTANIGGGMYNTWAQSSPKIYNSIIWGNTAADGTNIFNEDSTDRPEFHHSLIEGSGGSENWNDDFGTDGGSNIDNDPLFINPDDGDYSLQACSPAIDAGSNSYYADLDEDTKDLSGNPRVYNFGEGTIDMGAFEFQGAPVNYEDVIFEDETVVYNGAAQTIEAENIPAEAEVEYTFLDSEGDTIAQAVDAGAYTVIATFTGCGPEEMLSAVLTITPAELTITADEGQFKEYGTVEDPIFTFASSGWQGTDDASLLSGSLGRVAGEGMGTYAITQGDLDAGPNYEIKFISADFEIGIPVAIQPPNCSNFSPAISGSGTATVSAHDFVTNAGSGIYPIEVTVYDRWGMPLADWPQTFDAAIDIYEWPVCDLLGQTLEFSVSNSMGRCRLGVIELNGAPGPVMESAWRDGDSRPNVGQGKMIVYCGNIPAADTHRPDVHMPCGGTYSGPVAMPDWRDVNACGASDTAEVILRHWEATGRDGQRTTITDTIIVMRLPKLAAGAFVGTAKDTTYCKLHPYKEDGEDIYRFAAWKQPMGIADFEQPYSQMGALSYHIPGYVIEAGLINACNQSQSKYDSYLKYVIMKNPDGTVVTIRDIISGDYMFHPVTGVIARATTTQLGYGILNQIYEGATGLIDAVTIGGWSSCAPGTYTFYNYLFPVIGSQVLSENGTYETVTEEWFYNGTGNSPYWFSGGWPSIYGSGDCTSYCSGADVTALDNAVKIIVPGLVIDGDGNPYQGECDTIIVNSSTNCGLRIERENDDWTDFQSCVRERGGRTTITQTCWAGYDPLGDAEAPYQQCFGDVEVGADDCLVVKYEDRSECCGRVIITLNQIQQVIDRIPPIFDFCYPEGWEGVEAAVSAGVQHGFARDFEENNPTIYTTNSHECGATIYVPDITVSDNCSGVQSVRAVFHHLDGGVKKVALELTDTTLVPMGEGRVCTLYTYSHTKDPIHIPFTGCNGDPIEVVYNATDGCNESTWSKFVRVRDDVPPTVGTNHDVNVTMHSAVEYLGTDSYDQGSWDNCAIELMLVRRTDWASNTTIMDLCSDAPDNLDSWVKILSEVGFDATQVTTAVGGGVVNNVAIDIDKLDKYLNKGEIELYYLQQIKNLWRNGDCSEKVVHAWLFDLARALAENCASDDLSNTDLERIFDNLFNEAGYGNHVAYIGGGWAEMVPFTCEDACEEVPSELLVIDYCCNVGIGGTETYVKDNTQARVSKTLPNLTVSCEAYNLFFKDIVAEAEGYTGSDADTTGVFDKLNEVFGGYIVAGVDNQGRSVGTDGTLLPDSVLNFNFQNISCKEEGEGADKNVVLDTITETAANGIIATTCSGNYTQTVTVKMDECGLGTITRRFWVTNGCNGTAAKEIQSQTIVIESACPMRESMFDVPSNLGTVKNPVCLPREIANNNLLDTIGELKVKDDLMGKLCNSIAISHEVEVQKLVDYPDWIQYKITWKAIDWCCADALPEREYEFVQKVIARIDPECALDEGGDENGDISLVQGMIVTEEGAAVSNVEMKAVLGSGSPLTTVTSGDGAYNFSVQNGSNVSLVPSKNTGFSNGVTTYDLVLIQRHVLQKELLDSKYKRIAADVNGDGLINAFDVFELRQLVMNPSGQLANNTSWRFFEKNTDREVFEVSNLKGDVNVDWIGVKIGDVSRHSAETGSRRSDDAGTVHLNVADKQLKSGETYRMEVTSDNFADVMGMQYTLSYLPNQVEVESIEAGALNITENNYFRFAPGVITTSWSEADGQSLASDEVLFTIVLKAKSAVQLRDALSLNSRVTPVEAYAGGSVKDVSLRFDGGDTGFALYQNTPNPYQGETTIGFELPEAAKATLSVYDVTGKMLKVVEGEFVQGYNEVQLQSTDLNASGVLYYQLDTKTYTATKKMVVIKE